MADDEFTLRKAMERATQAQQLLENPLLIEAFKSLEESYIHVWKEAPTRDTEGREKLWQAVQIIGRVQSHLQTAVASGHLANRQIERDYLTPRKRFGLV